MSQQKQGQSTVDSSGKQTDSKNNATKSPEEQARIAEDQRKRAEKAEAEAKDAKAAAEKATAEAEELRQKLEGKADDKGDVSNAEIAKIAEDFDVDPKFAEALATAISTQSESKIKAAREDLEKEIAKRDQKDQQKAFDDAFGKAFTKATENLDAAIDEDAVKTVFLQRVKENKELTVAEVIEQMYGSTVGKVTSEDDTRGGGEGSGQEIDFETAGKDPKALKAIMADPEAKAKYYDWRLKQGL